jgi:general secretion pathway protein F
MSAYRYTALTAAGEPVAGLLDCPSEAAAIALLQRQGLIPIAAAASGGGAAASWRPWHRIFGQSLGGSELSFVSRQLSRLLIAGLPFDRALEILQGLMKTAAGRRAIGGTLARLKDGASLADALAAQDGAFPRLFVAMVRTGERGALPSVLERLAAFTARMEAVRQSILSAMIYPAILLLVAASSIGVVLTVVLPQFTPMFAESGRRLPWITRIVIGCGDALSATWWLAAPACLFAVAAYRAAMRQPHCRRLAAATALRLPVVGSLILRFDSFRFARTLAVLIGNGTEIAGAMPYACEAVSNAALAAALETITAELRRGDGLSGPLHRAGCFPPLLVQMVRVGEETGRLGELLGEAADLLEGEAEQITSRLVALLVPALTLFMGGTIGIIVAAVVLAMLSINDLGS